MEKPPLDIEQAIDLILATPAMFSKRSEGQREFGKLIPTLPLYWDNILIIKETLKNL